MYVNYYQSPIGKLILLADDMCFTGLYFEGGSNLPTIDAVEKDTPIFDKVKAWLDDYFSGRRPDKVDVNILFGGTPMQKKIWTALPQIPYGETMTYKALAEKLGTSPRVVGRAVAKNPVSIIVPCHRVIGSDGDLRGYSGGLDKKKYLLELEGIKLK